MNKEQFKIAIMRQAKNPSHLYFVLALDAFSDSTRRFIYPQKARYISDKHNLEILFEKVQEPKDFYYAVKFNDIDTLVGTKDLDADYEFLKAHFDLTNFGDGRVYQEEDISVISTAIVFRIIEHRIKMNEYGEFYNESMAHSELCFDLEDMCFLSENIEEAYKVLTDNKKKKYRFIYQPSPELSKGLKELDESLWVDTERTKLIKTLLNKLKSYKKPTTFNYFSFFYETLKTADISLNTKGNE